MVYKGPEKSRTGSVRSGTRSKQLLVSEIRPAFAATAEQWRSRSIYQIVTDRFALSPGAVVNECNLADRTWCGGTWNSIRENLDYIQNAGFTAIWISPVNQNYEGPTSAYGDAYVDVVVNNVMAASMSPDYSTYLFKDESFYHPYCQVDFSNITSEQQCWLGDQNVPLPDLDTENPNVVSKYSEWIADLVETYSIDGLRIDAAKHVKKSFWPGFVKSAGVFCMGEVFDPTVPTVADFQGADGLDSVLNFPLYYALVAAFAIPGPANMSALTDALAASQTALGNFLENQDLPRFHNISVDPQSLYNAMTFTFLSDGIPIIYYGQEQGFSGAADPYNREPLWLSNYTNTSSYQLISTLNHLRSFLINTTDWATQKINVLTSNNNGIAFQKGEVVTVLTNIGAPPQNFTNTAFKSPWSQGTSNRIGSLIACRQFVVASNGYLSVEYTKGGAPVVLVESSFLKGSGMCGTVMAELNSSSSSQTIAESSALRDTSLPWLASALIPLLFMTISPGRW
ncbi:glycoside hydrolase family 13 protein [Mycena vulgaris]|nr:glycoside hydrolase family 13 protein [Mycena vulgaris]